MPRGDQPSHRRALLGFLLAPLAGTFCFLLLMIFFDVPRGAVRAPLYILFLHPMFVGPAVYVCTWAVGIPAYAVLRRLHRLRPNWLIAVYTVAAALIMLGLLQGQCSRRVSPATWIAIAALTGAATGAVFVVCLFPTGGQEGGPPPTRPPDVDVRNGDRRSRH